MPQPAERRTRFAKCDPAWLTLDLSGRELRVLLALSLHADWTAQGHGRCFPKRDTLALVTKLQISHVSESIRTLSTKHRLITVVRLGRKNIYYVRAIGETAPMPPSDPEPFFRWLGEQGIRLTLTDDGRPAYLPGSRRFDDVASSLLLQSILSDYVRGLVPEKLRGALMANQAVRQGASL